jgi:hypothetical protein
MTASESANKIFQEVFDMIPESYRERYGIRLITANQFSAFPAMYAEIQEAKVSIIPNGKEILVEELPGKLIIDIVGSGKIHMYKNFTCIYTHL